MRNLDFSSWQGIMSTLLLVTLITFIGVGIRLLVMQTIQQRRERGNRQINERLKTLIAAYKVLGGSFTGNLLVDPRHLRDLRQQARTVPANDTDAAANGSASVLPQDAAETAPGLGSERARRMRDAVEAALSDVILLGTETQVRLAAQAANDMVAGRPIQTAELVVSLRNFIREVLDLEAIPASLSIPNQGPLRPASAGGSRAAPRSEGARGGGGGGGGMGGGGGTGMVAGTSLSSSSDTSPGG